MSAPSTAQSSSEGTEQPPATASSGMPSVPSQGSTRHTTPQASAPPSAPSQNQQEPPAAAAQQQAERQDAEAHHHGQQQQNQEDLPRYQRETQGHLHVDAQTKYKFRKPPPKPKEIVYPVFPRPSNVGVLPTALKVHPKGFKLLSKGSPLDRNMSTYFRLPPQPPRRLQEEQQHLKKVIDKHIAPGKHIKGVVLDGFMMLDATGVQDPEEATECVINDSNVVGVVDDDLSYFTNLTFLDVGENSLNFDDLVVLENLEELHMHCNTVDHLEKPELDGLEFFPRLHTLNLSFNQVPAADLHVLGELPSLSRVDLSCNRLTRLPTDCSFLHSITQLALENNKFSKQETLLALSTMPSLVEVNLNYNEFSSMPRIPDGGFPRLEVLGIASNQIVYFEDVYALTQLPQLRRVVLWGNPIERRQKDAEILFYEFGNLQIELVMDPPVPPKRKTGAFYAANTQNFMKVKDFRKVVSSKKQHQQSQVQHAPVQSNAPEQQPEQPEGSGGPSFFVTHTDAERSMQPENSTTAGLERMESGATELQQQQQQGASFDHSQQHGKGGGEQAAGNHSWIGNWEDTAQKNTSQNASRLNESAEEGNLSANNTNHSRQQQRRQVGRTSPSNNAMPMLYSGSQLVGQMQSVRPSVSRASSGFGGSDVDEVEIVKPNANVRSVMNELKRMLRQPLPALHAPSFAQSKGSTRK